LIETFSNETVQDLAEKLLMKLYDATEGDEWEEVNFIAIYNEVSRKYSPDNVRLRHNVLQCLLYDEFIMLAPDKSSVAITSQGKRHLGKMPSLKDSKKPKRYQKKL
jgi:hypothetical protein